LGFLHELLVWRFGSVAGCEVLRSRAGSDAHMPFATDLPQIVTELDALPRSKALQRKGTPVRERLTLTPS
jgi:hypothetical protein